MPREVDLLITDAHLLTMQGDGVGYVAEGAVAIRGDTIVDVGPTQELTERYQPEERLSAARKAVLPGLIDIHMHTYYAVVRGVAQDVANWMQMALAPYSKHLNHAARNAGTRLNVVEAMLAGTTTFGDYIPPFDGWAETFEEAGVRACLTPTINAFPPGGMAGWKLGELYPLDDEAGQASIAGALEFCDRWQGAAGGRITTMLGPQGADMLTESQLLEIKHHARDRNIMVHLHLAQGDREIDQLVKRYGERSPAFLQRICYLDEQLLGVHLTEATDEETDMIAASGTRMALCSGSIGIIDGIVPPAKRFRDAGGVVGLGSDQASGNNCNNIFNEMKLTALFNKIKFRDPEVMPAWEVLRMGTIDGARAIGLDHRIGSIEPGKQADLILVDVDTPNLLPIMDEPVRTLVPNLVYAGTGKEVHTVIVAGREIVRDRKVLTLPEESIRDEAQRQAEQVARRVAEDPLHRELTLVRAMQAGKL